MEVEEIVSLRHDTVIGADADDEIARFGSLTVSQFPGGP